MHPIPDKAEIAVDFPEKLYIGEFGRHSSFDAGTEADGVLIRLTRQGGEKRDTQIHLHYLLFGDILAEIARAVAKQTPIDALHREPLIEAARDLLEALERTPAATPAS
jgi:hypothetical protein